MRVLVCGGRDYSDGPKVFATLDALKPTSIAHGGATGADTYAERWAWQRKVKCKSYPANWKAQGKAAGPIRNQHMLLDFQPDLVVAFPGGRGTADMVRRANEAGVRVMDIQKATVGNADDIR